MDDLVLLAQMHGDGPKTVAAFRAGGIRTVDDLAALEPEELVQLIGIKPGAARKICEEARRMAAKPSTSAGDEREEKGAPAGGEGVAERASSIVARTKPRKRLADVLVGSETARSRETATNERNSAGAESEEGVDPDEAAVLGRARTAAAPVSKAMELTPPFVSFWRFG